MARIPPPPTRFGTFLGQAKPSEGWRRGPAIPPTRYDAAPLKGQVTAPAARPRLASQLLVVPSPPIFQSRVVLPFARQGVVQRALAATKRDALSGIFRNYAYPVGCADGLLAAEDEKEEEGSKKKYDVAAEVYNAKNELIGLGKYESNAHAEMNALNNALELGWSLDDIKVIKVSKGCCRRCAVVMKILGIHGKAGPKSSSSCTGAYVIPAKVQDELGAFCKLQNCTIDDLVWTIANGQWW
jgi:tRNA(Arg) A34 adenosine deaminase TadA